MGESRMVLSQLFDKILLLLVNDEYCGTAGNRLAYQVVNEVSLIVRTPKDLVVSPLVRAE